MNRLGTFSLMVATALLLCVGGCSYQVRVVDASGEPIPDVQVSAVSASANGEVTQTDAQGRATVKPAQWLAKPIGLVLNKPGYGWAWLEWPKQWPATVTLAKGGNVRECVRVFSALQAKSENSAPDQPPGKFPVSSGVKGTHMPSQQPIIDPHLMDFPKH